MEENRLKAFTSELNDLFKKYGFDVVMSETVLERKRVAYIRGNYVKDYMSLHFTRLLPATRSNVESADEITSRELEVGGFYLRRNCMRKFLKRLLEKLVAWGQRKMSEDTIGEKESERILREIEKLLEENKVK